MKTLDTNVLIYHVAGRLSPLDVTDFFISAITEIEALGHPNLDPAEEIKLRTVIQDLTVIPVDGAVINQAIILRRKTNLRLPDAIIAATAIVTGSQLLTHDAGLLKIEGLDAVAPRLKI